MAGEFEVRERSIVLENISRFALACSFLGWVAATNVGWGQSLEALTWTSVSGCTSVPEVEFYLKSFPDGEHVRDARECLERLARSEPRFRFNDGCASCPELVLIPAGTYTMGSERRETGRASNEEPRHDVTIGVPIAVGTYEVTLGEFRRFVEETEHRPADSCYTLSDKDRRVGPA